MSLPDLSPKQFSLFREFIYKKSGMRVDDRKIVMLSHRIRGRLVASGHDCYDAYYQHVSSIMGRKELTSFLDVVTTNETFFFRTGSHFDWFKKDFLNEQITAKREKGDQTMRVWSAACSTGEEAYSLAICLAETKLRLRDWDLQIVGTDISEAVLTVAREGTYGKRALEELDPTRVRRWFRANADVDRWTVRDEVQKPVRFVAHNLMEPTKEQPFDCIFIRNVLIYFDQKSKKTVVKHLIKALVPGGYLVVGPSEGIYDMLGELEKISTFLYRKPASPS